MTNRAGRLIFFSDVLEAEEYLRSRKIEEGDICIAMRPSVLAYLQQRGYPANDTMSYFTKSSHEKALEKSQEIINWLISSTGIIDPDIGIQGPHKDGFIFWTRAVVHHCIWIAEITANAIIRHRPKTVCAFCSGYMPSSSLYVQPCENYVGSLAKEAARVNGIKFEDIPSISRAKGGRCTRLRTYVTSCRDFVFRYWRFRMWQRIISIRCFLTGKRACFFNSRSYRMGEIFSRNPDIAGGGRFYLLMSPVVASFHLSEGIIRLFWRRDSKKIIAQKKAFEKLVRLVDEAKETFYYNGVSFAGLVARKIRENIADHVIGLILWSLQLSKFIDVVNPALFVSNGTRDDDLILAKLCRRKNIRSIFISHGSHVPPKNKYELIEWGEHGRMLARGPFSHIAIQSPLAEKYNSTFPGGGKEVRTGPLLWGNPVDDGKRRYFRQKILGEKFADENVKVVLHAGTPKPTNFLRFYVYETPDEYISALRDLASAVESIPDTVLVIKFRPAPEISMDDIKGLVPFSKKVILCADLPFNDALGIANLFVGFSSTTIEEALQNRIPVLLYGGGGRYQHVPAHEIHNGVTVPPKALYHVTDPRDLRYAMQNILALNIDDKSGKGLFDEYIFSESERVPLADLLTA